LDTIAMAREIQCPSCGKPVAWAPESRWRPFCSERCKLIDLGDWAAERHVIPGDRTEQETDMSLAAPDSPSRPRQ